MRLSSHCQTVHKLVSWQVCSEQCSEQHGDTADSPAELGHKELDRCAGVRLGPLCPALEKQSLSVKRGISQQHHIVQPRDNPSSCGSFLSSIAPSLIRSGLQSSLGFCVVVHRQPKLPFSLGNPLMVQN